MDQADAATFGEGEEVTFLRWGNFNIDKIEKSDGKVTSMQVGIYKFLLLLVLSKPVFTQSFNNIVISYFIIILQGRYNPDATNFSKTKKTTWLAAVVR